jgi:hypothetical protein
VLREHAMKTRTTAPVTQPAFITPPPTVRPSPNTYQWKCPCCRKRNDDGDSTCIHCGQDVDLLPTH